MNKEVLLENIEDILEVIDELNTDHDKIRSIRKSSERVNLEIKDINEIVKEAIKLSKGRASNRKLNIKPMLHAKDKLLVKCDLNYLRHALLNIIFNAFDAMEERKGVLEIETKPVENKAVIRISDNGIGIKKEDFPKIYTPYFTTKKTGTGIGLPITKYIVESVHNGKLNFKSEHKKGTTFSIELPLETE